jgi:sirohydrochlorin cobaltochelatase
MGFTGPWNGRTVLRQPDTGEASASRHKRYFPGVILTTQQISEENGSTRIGSSLVLVGHGSTVNPDSSRPTWDQADQIRQEGLFADVVCAFWKEEPSLREVLPMIETDEVYVVPHFISEGYFTQKVIPRELELTGPITWRDGKSIKYCEPVGNHPRMTDLLLQQAMRIAPGVALDQTALLVAAHGTGLNENSAVAAKKQVKEIGARNLFGQVAAVYLEEEPLISSWASLVHFPNVVVIPLFISDGLHSYEDIPALLGIEPASTGAASAQDVFRRNPYVLDEHTLYYGSAIGADPMMAEIILDMTYRFDQQHRTEFGPRHDS